MSGDLKLNFFDVSFERVKDEIDIRLEHTVLHKVYEQTKPSNTKTITIHGIDTSQGGRYVMYARPRHYRPIFRILRIKDNPDKNDEVVILPVDSSRVTKVNFPMYQNLPQSLTNVLTQSNVETFPGLQGQQLYDALEDDPVRKAGLFNLFAKMEATVFPIGRSVFSHVTSLTRLRGDRIFAQVQKELRDEVKNGVLNNMFKKADDSLHTPPPNFQHADSFKSFETYGNLQLTFFANPATLEFIVDADIDDAGGLQHIFQVLEHALTSDETNPYDIHEILVYYQHIDPGYQLVI